MENQTDLLNLEWPVWWPAWRLVADDSGSLLAELEREIHAQHPLYGVPTHPLARSETDDDVLFAIPDSAKPAFAVVHLTFPAEPLDDPKHPSVTFYDNLEDFLANHYTEYEATLKGEEKVAELEDDCE